MQFINCPVVPTNPPTNTATATATNTATATKTPDPTATVTKTPEPVQGLPNTGGTANGSTGSPLLNQLGIAMAIGFLMLGLITRPSRKRRQS